MKMRTARVNNTIPVAKLLNIKTAMKKHGRESVVDAVLEMGRENVEEKIEEETSTCDIRFEIIESKEDELEIKNTIQLNTPSDVITLLAYLRKNGKKTSIKHIDIINEDRIISDFVMKDENKKIEFYKLESYVNLITKKLLEKSIKKLVVYNDKLFGGQDFYIYV